jgi:predicted RNA binding protein YcfA (HicA-like mRNA interferase family)
MKAQEFERILKRAPLYYNLARQSGSHRRFEAPDRPPFTFSYHKGATIPPGVVRKILLKDIGLSEDEAMRILGREG